VVLQKRAGQWQVDHAGGVDFNWAPIVPESVKVVRRSRRALMALAAVSAVIFAAGVGYGSFAARPAVKAATLMQHAPSR